MDRFDITILEDGTIKLETGRVSAANHMTAEAALRFLAQACPGGSQTRTRLAHAHGGHAHEHEHEHEHHHQ